MIKNNHTFFNWFYKPLSVFEIVEQGGAMNEKEYKCKYCGKKMHKIDYEMYHGYCGKCREIMEWKRTLDHIKEFEE